MSVRPFVPTTDTPKSRGGGDGQTEQLTEASARRRQSFFPSDGPTEKFHLSNEALGLAKR